MPDLSNLSYFPEDKLEISIFLSWDKDFIAIIAKKSIQITIYIYIFLILEENKIMYSLKVPP